MPITINDCKCGGQPRFETDSSDSCDSCDFDTFYFQCRLCRYKIEPQFTFERAVALWNDLNTTCKECLQVEAVGDSD